MSNTQHPELSIRPVTRSQAKVFLTLIDALADYEHLDRPDSAARDRLVLDGFGQNPRYQAFIAWLGEQAIGYAIIYETYSSFLALPTLYLEDIFVLPDFRGIRAGLSLFLHAAGIARERGCGRMDWQVLDWNTLAQDFYEGLGATHMKEWQLWRLDREALDALPNP